MRLIHTCLINLLLLFFVNESHGLVYYNNPVVIGVSWPISQWWQLEGPLQLALDDFAPIFPVNVSLVYLDSGSLAPTTVKTAMTAHTQLSTAMIAMLGTSDSLSSVALVNVCGALTIPVLQVASYSTSLTVSGGTMIRSAYAFTAYGQAINLLLARQQWYHVAIVHTLDVEGLEISNYMLQNPLSTNTTYQIYALPSTDEHAMPVIARMLTDLTKQGLRIIIVHGSQTKNVLQMANAAGLMQAPMSWIGTNWCRDASVVSLLPPSSLQGVVCADASQPVDAFAAFQQRLKLLDPMATTPPVPFLSTFAYDAIGALAYAMNAQQIQGINATSSSKVTSLFKTLSTVAFNGSTTPFSFPTTTATDRVGYIDVLNYQVVDDTAQLQVVGSFVQNDIKLNLASEIIYSNSNPYGQSDRAGVYYLEEQLVWQRDSRLSILAYVISTLGFWIMLLLIEQALGARRKSVLLSWTTAVYLRRRATMTWIAWTGLSGLLLGLVGIWQPVMIQLFGISVNALSWSLDPSVWVVCAVIGVVGTWMALFPSLLNLHKHSSWLMSHGMSSNMNETTMLSSRTVVPVSVTRKTSNVQASISVSGAQKRSLQPEQTRLTLLRLLFRQTLSWRLVWCSATFAGTIVLCHWTLYSQVNGALVDHTNAIQFIDAFFMAWFTSWIPWWLVFHWHRSIARFTVAFMLALITWGTNEFLITYAHTWTYNADVSDMSINTYNPGEIASIVLAASGVILCSIALGINVTYLQLSQSVLRKYLREIAARIVQHENKSQKLDASVNELTRRYWMLQTWINLITYDRPYSREHAQIWCTTWHDEALTLHCLRKKQLPANMEDESAINHVFSLDEILSNWYGLELLRDVSQAKLTPENVMFHCAVELYKQIQQESVRAALLLEIMRLYIHENAPYEININSQLRQQTIARATNMGADDLLVFDAADREVMSLVQTNDLQICLNRMTPFQTRLLRAKS